jgi:hypothetical protein
VSAHKWDGTQNYQPIIKIMYYLRKDKAGHNIYNCPNCSAEIRASGEMIEYIVSQIMSDRAKALCNKLTPEERKAKAIKAINTRWNRVRAINGTVPPSA